MTILIATMFFAQSLLSNLVGKAADEAAPAPIEEARAEEPAPAEPKAAEPKQETPENPENPKSPEVPETPDIPESPEVPETPDNPVVPTEPLPAPEPVVEEPAPEEPAPTTSSPDLPTPRSVKITSDRTDYDRREGVIMFDRNVFVEDEEYKMHSDQLYVFLDGTNELKRIVAIGNVTITNETRVGSCAKAAYTRSIGKVVMYGDGKGVMAKLADNGKRKSEVEGRKITFWIASEQVEVEGSKVTLDTGGLGGKEGAKKLLGK